MELDKLRENIDRIDDTLLELLNERMEYVHKVGTLKHNTNAPIYRPEREQSILKRLKEKNNGKLTDSAIDAIFLELFAVARNLELPERIAYLGPEASFTHQAAESRFGALSSYLPIKTIKGVFRGVADGKAKFGVIPIENNTHGIVTDTIQCLSDYNLKIIAEVVMDVHHSFASLNENLKDIKRIYSKDEAFSQCQRFLTDFGLDEIERIPVDSTAKAAKMASTELGSAAICSEVASTLYNLPVLFKNIEDSSSNKTRFFIVSNFENLPSGNDKTSILVKMPNEPGALVSFLQDFQSVDINLTKIKSHIVDGESIFFLEFNGHREDKKIKDIFKKQKKSIKYLGSYVKETDDI
ncbi:Chorismate mutase I / Prephenate dehydratase [hydrothermal vent metagenome]|uniref:Bifunctional chorismate mutase/prephenate dehydratase n=1 Tax=hydrothermal vent metagenome TaxID=652676 RepID=A0A1W1BYI4_9ZZZZ